MNYGKRDNIEIILPSTNYEFIYLLISMLVDLTARALSLVPPWMRVYRIQRDIPMPLVTSGVETGSLRQLALQRMADLV